MRLGSRSAAATIITSATGPITDAARAVTRTGRVAAVGVNCTPPQYVESLLNDARAVADLPLVCYPNWGRVWDGATYE